MISQGDYEYLKQRLLEDEQLTFYYIVRLIAATGVRVSELVEFNCEDVAHGYRNIISKGNKIRRVYIPSGLQSRLKDWLSNEGRKKGASFFESQRMPYVCLRSTQTVKGTWMPLWT